MIKTISANSVPNQYIIHEEKGEKFIFAQPYGERIIIHDRPSLVKTITVALSVSAVLAGCLVYWLFK